jgi:excinuclease ABC subunit C
MATKVLEYDLMSGLEAKRAPTSSGVYFFRDKRGRILYIGKAANLRNRLKSYFDSRPKEPRIAQMLAISSRLVWRETDSEIEALILESQLIKKYHPQFNIMLRDDKQYFYVIFTKEEFPKIYITHQPGTQEHSTKNGPAGPFTDGKALRATLKLLRRAFPYCTCKQKHNNYCLNYHIGNCLGFCCLKNKNEISKTVLQEYAKNIKLIKEILSGKRIPLVKKLEKEMAALAKNGKFEKAIELRDKLEKLKKVFENAQIIRSNKQPETSNLKTLKKEFHLPGLPSRIEGYDISNIQGKFATGSMVVFSNGQPDKNQYRKFKIRIENSPNDIAMLKEVLTRRFNHPEWLYPNLVIVDGGLAQLNAARQTLPEKIPIVALTKDERHRGDHIFTSLRGSAKISLTKLSPAVRNLILQIDAEAHRFAINYYRKLHKKSL